MSCTLANQPQDKAQCMSNAKAELVKVVFISLDSLNIAEMRSVIFIGVYRPVFFKKKNSYPTDHSQLFAFQLHSSRCTTRAR